MKSASIAILILKGNGKSHDWGLGTGGKEPRSTDSRGRYAQHQAYQGTLVISGPSNRYTGTEVTYSWDVDQR